MTAILLWGVAASIVLASERRAARPTFCLVAFAFLTALFLLATGDLPRATLLALILALTIVGASAVKHHHSGMKLAVADLALTFAGTIPFMLRQYRRTATLTIAGAVLLALAAVATLALVGGAPIAFPLRLLAFAIACAALYGAWRFDGGTAYRVDVTRQDRFLSFFIASLVDIASWWPSGGLRMLDVATTPLPLAAPIPARSPIRPDIIVIQHESVFDPRLYGLPVEPHLEAFFAPPGALTGRLHVDIYGGGSWQTEFSLLTGLSSANFGPDSYFLFKKGVGRFRHSLPGELAGLGYRSLLSTSCRRAFMNYDAFYAGLDVKERVFSDEFPAPFDLAAFEITNSDADFFAATRGAIERSIDRDPAPRFVMALTNYNHGPHETRLVPAGRYEDERRFALAALPDATYGEYYARLAETAESYAAFRDALKARYPDRPMLFLRYGDHQPTMSRAIEAARDIAPDDPRQFETFYAIEAVNFEPAIATAPTTLDIAMLGTVALQAAGLPLDAVSATRASLIDECGALYMATPSERKNRFHRTLVDQGLIDLGNLAGLAARDRTGMMRHPHDGRTPMTSYDDANIFARILRGEIPSHRVYEDAETIAFMDVMPQGPGHLLVVPKTPSRNLLDAAPDTLSRLMPVVQKLARAVKSAFAADGVTVMQFNEPASGQTVFHLHIHIVPRFEGEPLHPHSGTMEKPEILAEHAERVRAALAAG